MCHHARGSPCDYEAAPCARPGQELLAIVLGWFLLMTQLGTRLVAGARYCPGLLESAFAPRAKATKATLNS
jgi:hypothetical protein